MFYIHAYICTNGSERRSTFVNVPKSNHRNGSEITNEERKTDPSDDVDRERTKRQKKRKIRKKKEDREWRVKKKSQRIWIMFVDEEQLTRRSHRQIES